VKKDAQIYYSFYEMTRQKSKKSVQLIQRTLFLCDLSVAGFFLF